MLGTKERTFAPLCNVSLESLVPADHVYRHLQAKLDLGFVRDLVRDMYKDGGRPSIDPIVFFKLQLVMFFEGIRSERQLVRVAADRLSLRWYLGYDLDEALPDHSSLTKIRKRYGLAAFRRFFEQILEQCRAAGLIWGKELYLDATQVEANASLHSIAPRFVVEAHLGELFAGGTAPAEDAEQVPPTELPVPIEEVEREALAEANSGRHDWLARDGWPDRSVVHGTYRRRTDFEASTTDPDAALMGRKSGGLHFGYHDHYAVDGGKARIILEVLVTPADVMENHPMLDLTWRARARWRLPLRQVTGDKKYATVDNIRAIEEQGVRAYVALADWDRTEYYGPSKFTYDPEQDEYRCPQGQPLRRCTVASHKQTTMYRADPAACNACPVKAACTASQAGRTITRSFFAEYVDRVRDYQQTSAYQKALRKRSVWVEPLFAEGKGWHGLRRFRLRGLWKVTTEALLIAAGQNLKRLLRKRGWGQRPWPGGAPGVFSGVQEPAYAIGGLF